MQTKIFIDTGRESWDSPKGATGNEFGLHVRPGSAEMGSEKELLEAFERIIHQDFPNPQRIGCPEDEALLKLAGGSGQVYQTHLLAHIRQCAPCFDKLKELRSQARNRSPQDICD
jgi:hypothetical protein